ncbi:hypothetical protein [Streptomyces sp. NPDC002785]|uniref:hypothetical protein n=1 Tax=Streptomyces sp. NPDC002785 TaxID=3154543 RepID=UPI00332D6994
MTDKPETERVDCFALPGPDNTRITYVKTSGGISETWHNPDCPALAIMQINMEEGSKRVREQDAWAQGVFPAAHERLRKAAAAMPADTAAQPFADALSELVQAQADTTGFVVLHRWGRSSTVQVRRTCGRRVHSLMGRPFLLPSAGSRPAPGGEGRGVGGTPQCRHLPCMQRGHLQK